MKFLAIFPKDQRTQVIDAMDFGTAYIQAGMEQQNFDHGVVCRFVDGSGIGIFISEGGLYSSEPEYFAINKLLYHGPAMLYAYDQKIGETISLDIFPSAILQQPVWLGSVENVENAINKGLIDRPTISVNGKILWSWPEGIGDPYTIEKNARRIVAELVKKL